MHGNVREWCGDWYGRYPSGPATGPGRVVRGGSWFTDMGACRSAARHQRPPGDRDFSVGFRVAAEAK
jgi:formylglycine-generating enzyme required for sulfatase activity